VKVLVSCCVIVFVCIFGVREVFVKVMYVGTTFVVVVVHV
jgi:hypothetical protein